MLVRGYAALRRLCKNNNFNFLVMVLIIASTVRPTTNPDPFFPYVSQGLWYMVYMFVRVNGTTWYTV